MGIGKGKTGHHKEQNLCYANISFFSLFNLGSICRTGSESEKTRIELMN